MKVRDRAQPSPVEGGVLWDFGQDGSIILELPPYKVTLNAIEISHIANYWDHMFGHLKPPPKGAPPRGAPLPGFGTPET
jgi:hypothetical protein